MNVAPATIDELTWAYRLLLRREPDAAGFEHYVRKIEVDRLSATELVAEFVGSAEFARLYGSSRPYPSLVDAPPLKWQPCTLASLQSTNFQHWAVQLRERQPRPHRKIWEWAFIAQALHERGCLVDGAQGLGFAVGTEPLAALFAKVGCHVVATDLDLKAASKGGWNRTHEHAANIGVLNERNICDAGKFSDNVRFMNVDMCDVPDELIGFDFLWSSCAIEHLGSIDAALAFVMRAMRCLKPGGLAVHTTEFNCESDTRTIERGKDVIPRKSDFMRLREALVREGHDVGEIDFTLGTSEADLSVDEAPFKGPSHLKLRIGGFASTSFGMIIRKSTNPTAATP